MQWRKKRQLRFIHDAPVIRVATLGRQGRPQVTPVCHVEWKEKIYWASEPGSVKLANISRHRWVALVADTYKSNWRKMGGVMVQGKAKILTAGPLFRKVRDLLYKKFKVYKSKAGFEEGESLVIEVTPSRLFNWWYE